jgi:hypothetical protein
LLPRLRHGHSSRIDEGEEFEATSRRMGGVRVVLVTELDELVEEL